MPAGLATRIAHLHPRLWQLSWNAAHRLPFLLPHDKSYLALRHFIAFESQGLFLDVGANDGISVLSFRSLNDLAKDYRIISLEPNTMHEPALRALSASDPRMTYRMVAAGAAPGRLTFHVPVYRGIAVHPLAAADPGQAREAMRANFGDRVTAETEMRQVESGVIRLDELCVDPTIIKIDAEGAELDVLKGASATIERSRPYLMIEIVWKDRDDIVAFLTEHNYAMFGYDERRREFVPHGNMSNDLWGARNFFGIPAEKMTTLPIRQSFAVYGHGRGPK